MPIFFPFIRLPPPDRRAVNPNRKPRGVRGPKQRAWIETTASVPSLIRRGGDHTRPLGLPPERPESLFAVFVGVSVMLGTMWWLFAGIWIAADWIGG